MTDRAYALATLLGLLLLAWGLALLFGAWAWPTAGGLYLLGLSGARTVGLIWWHGLQHVDPGERKT